MRLEKRQWPRQPISRTMQRRHVHEYAVFVSNDNDRRTAIREDGSQEWQNAGDRLYAMGVDGHNLATWEAFLKCQSRRTPFVS